MFGKFRKGKNGIAIKPSKKKVRGPSLTEAQAQLLGDIKKVKNMVDSLDRAVTQFQKGFSIAQEKYNCHQFQLIQQDLESILMHIKDLEENGPKESHREVPLEESEMNEPLEVQFGVKLAQQMKEDSQKTSEI